MDRDESEPRTDGTNGETGRYDRRSFMAITSATGMVGAFGGRFDLGDVRAVGDARRTGDDAASAAAENGNEELPTGTEALLGYIEANYGDRLSDEDVDAIEADIAADLDAAAAVNEVPLENGDAPAYEFEVYREEEGEE